MNGAPEANNFSGNIQVLHDLTKKAANDARNALQTPMELAGEMSGAVGMFGLLQKVASQIMVGSGLVFAAMRDDLPQTPEVIDNDDLLLVCLMAYEAEKVDAKEEGFLDRVHSNFKKITGRKCKIPDWWRKNK